MALRDALAAARHALDAYGLERYAELSAKRKRGRRPAVKAEALACLRKAVRLLRQCGDGYAAVYDLAFAAATLGARARAGEKCPRVKGPEVQPPVQLVLFDLPQTPPA
jgi:hypothetical protein